MHKRRRHAFATHDIKARNLEDLPQVHSSPEYQNGTNNQLYWVHIDSRYQRNVHPCGSDIVVVVRLRFAEQKARDFIGRRHDNRMLSGKRRSSDM